MLVYLLISLPGTQAVFSSPEFGRFSAGPAVLYICCDSLVDFLQVLQYSICCDSIGGLKKIDEQRDPCIESGLYNRLEGKKFADMTKVDEP